MTTTRAARRAQCADCGWWTRDVGVAGQRELTSHYIAHGNARRRAPLCPIVANEGKSRGAGVVEAHEKYPSTLWGVDEWVTLLTVKPIVFDRIMWGIADATYAWHRNTNRSVLSKRDADEQHRIDALLGIGPGPRHEARAAREQ